MNMLTKLYTEIRRYGEILDDMSWEDSRGNMRAMLIRHEDNNYNILLANGEAIEITVVEFDCFYMAKWPVRVISFMCLIKRFN